MKSDFRGLYVLPLLESRIIIISICPMVYYLRHSDSECLEIVNL